MKSYPITASRIKPHEIDLAGGPLPLAWFAISSTIEPDVACRRAWTGKWWKISSSKGVIYRTVRFSGYNYLKQDSTTKHWKIVLDYDGWVLLAGEAEDLDSTIDLEIQPLRFWEVLWTTHTHPDPAIRVATWLAYISVVLGVFGVVLGFLGVVFGIWGVCK